MTAVIVDSPVATARGRRPSWLVSASVALVALVVAVAALAWTNRSAEIGPAGRALEIARDDAQFATATEAGAAYTRISVILQEGAERCMADDGARCDDLFATAAYTRVSAVSLLSCTKRRVVLARQDLTSYLEDLEAGTPTPLPNVPSCAPGGER